MFPKIEPVLWEPLDPNTEGVVVEPNTELDPVAPNTEELEEPKAEPVLDPKTDVLDPEPVLDPDPKTDPEPNANPVPLELDAPNMDFDVPNPLAESKADFDGLVENPEEEANEMLEKEGVLEVED